MIRRYLRLSLPAIAAMAWRNRDELAEWAGFGVRAVLAAAPGGDDFEDVKAEARLRLALARDRRTRRTDGLHVEVHEGIAFLSGVVSREVYDVAPAIAEGIEGIALVDNRMREVGRRRTRRSDVNRGR